MIKEELNDNSRGGDEQPAALFKLLGHPERLAILRRLMAAPATLTQLGAAFERSPAHIRHHLQALEQAGLVEFAGARPVQGGPEKYYRATQPAIFIHQALLPEQAGSPPSLTIGSLDSGVRQIENLLAERQAPLKLWLAPLSSLDGLIAMRQGLCQASTCHLIDAQSGEYNRSFIRSLFPGQAVALIRVYQREEGLIVGAGNPFGLRALEDLARPDVRFINREPGSGVRQWLDMRLRQLGILPGQINGFADVVRSHDAVAAAVQRGLADAGIGIAASARERGLEFLPLFEEPYEIAIPQALLDEPSYAPFFETIQSGEFRAALGGLAGYYVPQASGSIEIVG